MKNDFKTLLISSCVDYAIDILSGYKKEKNNNILNLKEYQDKISDIFVDFDKKDVVEVMKGMATEETTKQLLDFAITCNDCRCCSYLTLLTIFFSENTVIHDYLSKKEYMTEENFLLLYFSVKGFRTLEHFMDYVEGIEG